MTDAAALGSTGPAGYPVRSDQPVPDGLLAAFEAYEHALATNDQAALAETFEPSPDTLRADAGGLLIGHDAISAFRGRRSDVPKRGIAELQLRVLDDDTALVVSVNLPATGGRGIVTQLWRRAEGRWRVAAAQVQAPAPAIDARIWRVAGAPLVQPSDEAAAGGALAGETVAVKDLFAVAGHAIGAGVPAYLAESRVAEFTAPAVQSLLDAGASVLGIAQTDEFAFSIAGRNSAYGTPPNAVVPGAIPGGSSSGPAAAVALGQASIGLGTDTGGSIRVPASYQGLWGLRSSHGAVRRTDLLPLAPSFDTVGWLTRDAELLERVAEATLVGTSGTAAPQQEDVSATFVIDQRLLASVSGEVGEAFSATVDRLVDNGRIARPDDVALGDVAQLYELFRVIQAAEAWQSHGAWIESHPGSLAPDVEARFHFGSSISREQERLARVEAAAERQHLDRILAGRVLLLPSASSAAPPLTATAAEFDAIRAATLGLTCLAGLGGYPAVSAPLMTVPGGPVGLCLVGPRGTDLALVRLAASLA